MADEVEPIPRILRVNRRVRGKMWLAGSGPRNARIMLVTAVPLKEEAAEEVAVGYGKTMPHKPRMGDCAEANALKKIALRNGLDFNQCFYVPIVRYFPDDLKHHTRPTIAMLRECLPLLEEDIKEIKPEIIVCVGKIPFDVLYKTKYRESEIYGAWFWSDAYKCKIYPTLSPYQALKAELHERYAMDFRAVQKMFESMHGHQVQPMEANAHVIENSAQLREFTEMLRDNGCTMLSVDCEWHGNQHVDGKLRSLQIAWSETDAAYIRFMDDKLNYVFDVSYKEAGAILGEWLNQPQVKYCGHHLAVDLSWMSYWLGLEWWEKGAFDTEFALQCCDESLDLGLDALALRYTDFGKYDMELINWKKQHGNLCKEGYGYIPDEILIPYGVRDVLTVMRAMPVIKQWLIDQDLLYYYEKFFNPLVTDVNISFTIRGIPIDRDGLDHKRRLYQWAKAEIEKEFQKKMTEEAGTLLLSSLQKIPDITFTESYKAYKAFANDVVNGDAEKAVKALRDAAGAQLWPEMEPVVEHYLCAPNFNIRSKPQMARWLYQVKGYTPVKSTQNKSAGMPSVAWEKVLTYPPDKQRLFTPATDTQTLETLAAKHKDKTIDLLLELNGIGNITKAFLKDSDLDDEGNLVKENGLHYWLASDDAIHVNHSTTETGRLRSWNPNVLNWPSWAHARLAAGMVRIVNQRHEEGALPKEFERYVGIKGSKFPSIRGACMARKGWCIVEADFQTAEMRGLAYISGDEMLRSTIEEPDPNFAKVKPEAVPDGVDPEDCVCRLAFPEYIKFPEDKDKYLMTYAHDGEIVAKFTEDDLLRDENNSIVNTKYDSHWRIAELARKTCRESMNKKKDRGAAKSTNFSSSYGGQANSIARKIEADTGIPQDPDDIQGMLDAIAAGQPRATAFLSEMENTPRLGRNLRAASGRIRHCLTLAADFQGVSARTREGQITALGRECRNFPMQESVGAAAAVSCKELIRFSRTPGLVGYPCICLYDSLVIHCPVNERSIWQKALELYMYKANGWQYSNRILRYPVDVELNAGWSTKPDQEFHDLLHDPAWEPTPDSLKHLENWLDMQLQLYTMNPTLSVRNTRKYDSLF